MIQREPGDRLSIDQYLEQERGLAFPEHFYSFLWPFLKQFAVTPIMPHDDKIKQYVMLIIVYLYSAVFSMLIMYNSKTFEYGVGLKGEIC